ncbi:MAG: sigma-70 family RNA polymerase sigma factor [Candidatus Doudnabacteria bacterium]|nr:sigma-70 family RNA polymerase sigma factor [Candidatus Doudnabacteria bacterium]
MEINHLVKLARDGDEEAFGQIYDNFAQKIFKFIRYKIQNRQEAEDVLQEVFTKAYIGLGSFSMENLNFSAWLYKVAGNTINDHFRKKYRSPVTAAIDENFDAPSGYSLQDEAATKWDWNLARDAFSQLPAVYRQVLELRFVQELSVDEVADILHKSNLSVRLIQHRALKKVRQILNNYDLGYQKI